MSEAAVLNWEPAAPGGPDWLEALRTEAWSRFRDLGLPQATDEEWKQTNPAEIVRTGWLPAPPVGDAEAAPALPPGLGGPRLVLAAGRVMPALSDLDGLPGGARLASLAELLADRPEAVRPHLGRIAPHGERAFAALNTARIEDGAVLIVPAGVALPVPVEIVHLAHPGSGPTATHPRTLVVLGARSQAVVVERFAGGGDGTGFTNAVAEAEVGEEGTLHHVRVLREGAGTRHVGLVWGHLGRNARAVSHSVVLGSPLARIDLGWVLDGEGAEARLDGLYLAGEGEHVDHHTHLDHARPHCPSREVYKGILSGSGKAVFHGRIVVRREAQRTDAKQANRNLLLSPEASVHTRPQLEIYADDVKCTHGATIGRLDPEQLFYLRARGIAEADARRLLIRAFAGEVLDRIPVPALREALDRAVAERLHL